jgi:hypothetical protein
LIHHLLVIRPGYRLGDRGVDGAIRRFSLRFRLFVPSIDQMDQTLIGESPGSKE